MLSVVADVARPPRAVFLRGDESEVDSNGRCDEAAVCCVVVVLTARLPARGLDLMISLY